MLNPSPSREGAVGGRCIAHITNYLMCTNTHREWELEALLNKLGNEFELAIVDRGYDKGNWFVAVRKVGDALVASW